ncbi:Thiol-disulfide isomerase or thioredoxin [Aquiflexum balticum DSM 16537]|uniref:Thiol-disulfide isomerase or thioredoxin n=1 Tax=Aquiflexum balticum DSM 16537 TaxID=758820 RepID=A0A1W2HB50_9BACT|nr:Thiol-disulfide isomerase or thioredoxin [Aquiflexum balticum DSM 16537]
MENAEESFTSTQMINKKTILFGLAFFGILAIIVYPTKFGRKIRQKTKMELLGTGLIQPKIEPNSLKAEEIGFNYEGSLLSIKGIPIKLEDFKGKTLFINIWASWCGPCRAEMPYINSLYEKLQENQNVEFLMIAIDEDFEKSKNYISGKNFIFPVYHAFEGLNSSLDTKSIPMTVVVNAEGKVIFKDKGMNNFDTEDFRTFLLTQRKTSK